MSPTGLYPLRKVQVGFEATPGQAVAATQKLVGQAAIKPIIQWDQEDYPRGIRVPADEYLAIMKGCEYTHETDLTYEEILYPLETGIVAVTATGSGPYVRVYPATVAPTLKALTGEMVVEDGTTKHYEREFAYLTTQQFQVTMRANERAKLNWTMFGRAEQSSTMTASLTPVTGRTPVPSSLFGLWIDSTWAGLGTTQKTLTLREADLTVVTGVAADFTLDAREDVDFTALQLQQMTATLRTVFRHTAAAATEVGNWRTGARRFLRLKADNGAAAGANKQIQFDLSMRLVDWDFGQEDGQEQVTANWELVYDTTAAESFTATVTNGLATLP